MQIGFATQAAAVMLFVGLYLVSKPYNIAKWRANDETTQRRMHKREQSHKKKSQRMEYKGIQKEVEPEASSVIAFRVIGIVLVVVGLLLGAWSLGFIG